MYKSNRFRLYSTNNQKKQIYKIFVFIGILLSFFAFLFWLFFMVISSRRPNYIFSISSVGVDCSKREYSLYYEKDDVKYYSACYDKVNVREEKFIFKKTDDIKKYIDNGQLLSILQKFDMDKWQYSEGIQTDYYVLDSSKSLIITRCSSDSYDTYYFHRSVDGYFCQYFVDFDIQ